jgi:raffinose/stachyose/melibiose transport system substrate-binding protein
LVDEYNASTGNKINFKVETAADRPSYDQKLRTMISGGQMPDLFDLDPTPYAEKLANAGKLVDMEAFLKEIGEFDKYIPLALDYLRLPSGQLYAIPNEFTTEMIWYNTDIFNEYGLSAPTTFDEWINVCEVLKSNDVTPIAIDGVDGWPLMRYIAQVPFREAGNDFLTDLSTGKAKMSDPIGMDAANFVADIGKYFQTGFSSADYASAQNLFLSGKTAMFEIGTWELGNYIKANRPENLNVDYFYMPMTDNATTAANEYWAFGGIGLACNIDSNDATMKDLLTYIVKNYSSLYLSKQHFPPQKVEITNEADYDELFIKIKNDMEVIGTQSCRPWDVVLPADVVATINDNLVGVAMGEMSPADFAAVVDDSLALNIK